MAEDLDADFQRAIDLDNARDERQRTSDPKPPKRIRDPEMMRRLHLELAGEPCDHCDARPGAHLHHIRYRSRGGDDVRSNLAWLCSVCHSAVHDGRLHL